MFTLVCESCGRTAAVDPRGRVFGQPILDWFEAQGRRCSTCAREHATPDVTSIVKALRTEALPTDSTIQQKFEQFHRLNPWVAEAFEKLTGEYVEATKGRRRLGIGMLTEIVRWQYDITVVDPNSDFRINNNYRSRYARLLIEQRPEWARLFETRVLRTA